MNNAHKCDARDCKQLSKKHNKLYWRAPNGDFKSGYFCRNCWSRLQGLTPTWQQDWNSLWEPRGKYYQTLKELKASLVTNALMP